MAKWGPLLFAAARRWILGMLLVGAGLAGCSPDNEPGPRAIDGAFPPTGELPQLPFRVTDQTGLIRAIAVVKADEVVPEGVSQVTGRDDALYLEWRGGLCDRRVLVVFEQQAGGPAFTVNTEADLGGCRLMGVHRSLVIEFARPIDASTVSVSAAE
jgi:hypothetical protein